MKSREYLVFLPPRLGGADLIIPMLFDWAKKLDGFDRVRLIFPTTELFNTFCRNQLLFNTFQLMGCKKIVFPSKNFIGNIFALIELIICAVILLAKSHKGKEIILLHSDDFLVRFITLYKIFVPKAIFCRCPKSMNYNNKHRSVTRTQKSTSDYIFIFNENSKADFKISSGQNFTVIGFPRFYTSWVEHLKAESASNIHRTFETQDKFRVAIFMSSSVKEVFSESENFEWFVDVITALKNSDNSIEIVVKPHPMVSRKLKSKIQGMYPSEFKFTDNQIGLIAYQSDIIILRHSSAILDSLCFNTPTIFYQRFTDHWLKRHPLKSHFLPFVKFSAETTSELEENIKNIIALINAGENFEHVYRSKKNNLIRIKKFPELL